MNIFNGIITNKAITVPAIAWLVAQLIKVAVVIIRDRRLDFTRLVGSGGMPSSHSAYMISLATVIGEQCGWDSPEFAISIAVAAVVMYDAAGIRRAAGKQAKVLNRLIHSHGDKTAIDENLKELLGHTPLEVIMGAILGIIAGVVLGG